LNGCEAGTGDEVRLLRKNTSICKHIDYTRAGSSDENDLGGVAIALFLVACLDGNVASLRDDKLLYLDGETRNLKFGRYGCTDISG
jgi:hypothetical protein